MFKQQQQEFAQKIDLQCNQINELKRLIEVLSSTVIGQLVNKVSVR